MRAAAVLALVASVSSSRSATARPDLKLQPESAHVVISFDVGSINQVFAELSALSVANRVAVSFLRANIDSVLRFASAKPANWSTVGIDPSKPASASLTLDTKRFMSAYEQTVAARAGSKLKPAAAPVHHFRLVLPVVDAKRSESFLRSMAKKLDGQNRAFSITVSKQRAVVDVAFSLSAPAPAELKAALKPAIGDGFADRNKAAALVRRAGGVAAWTSARAIEHIGEIAVRQLHLFELAANPNLRNPRPIMTHVDCADLSSGARVLFDDVAVWIRAGKGRLDIEAALGADAKALTQAMPRAAHGLDTHRRKGASGWVVSWLSSIAPMRSLFRSRAFHSWTRTVLLIRQCGPHHALAARLFGWPVLVGLFGDELATVGPRAKITVENLGAGAAVISKWHRDPLQLAGVMEGPLRKAAEAPARSLFDKVFGKPRATGAQTSWGRGRLRPYISSDRIGMTLGGDAGDKWFTRAQVGDAPKWLTGSELAAAWFDGNGLAGLADWEPTLAVLGGAKEARARLFLRGEQLVLGLEIARK